MGSSSRSSSRAAITRSIRGSVAQAVSGFMKRKPPPAISGCSVEQYAIRERSMKYSGHGWLYRDGKEVGSVPRLAICRSREGEVGLIHCDRRWNDLGASWHRTVREAKKRAERIYPGISAAWTRTGYTKTRVKRYLDGIGHNLKCNFCGKPWYQVDRMVTKGQASICAPCVAELSEMIQVDNHEADASQI
jgi:ClpX C4-type zinc finger protein